MVARGMSATAFSARRNSCPISSASARVITSVGRLGRAELGDLGAGGEDAVAAGDHDGAGRVVAKVLGRPSASSRSSAVRQRVDLGVVEADDGDAVVAPFEVHERRRHGRGR